jgi:hypothetical protein
VEEWEPGDGETEFGDNPGVGLIGAIAGKGWSAALRGVVACASRGVCVVPQRKKTVDREQAGRLQLGEGLR